MSALMQIISVDDNYNIQQFMNNKPMCYINCPKADTLSSAQPNGNIPKIWDILNGVNLEFNEDVRNTEWYPYSELKQLSVTVDHTSESIFSVSGTTLYLLDVLLYGGTLVKNNIKWNRLTIPVGNISIGSLQGSNIKCNVAVGELCAYHDKEKYIKLSSMLVNKSGPDTIKLILEYTQNADCPVCNGLSNNNIMYTPEPGSVIDMSLSWTVLVRTIRYRLATEPFVTDMVEYNQEVSVVLEPGITEYNINIPFDYPTYQLVWAVVDRQYGLLTIGDDLILRTNLQLNGHDRFDYDKYQSLVYDKQVHNIKINSNLAVHTYTFGNLYNKVEDSIGSSINFSRINGRNLIIRTKPVPADRNLFIHIFAVNVNQLRYEFGGVRKLSPFGPENQIASQTVLTPIFDDNLNSNPATENNL